MRSPGRIARISVVLVVSACAACTVKPAAPPTQPASPTVQPPSPEGRRLQPQKLTGDCPVQSEMAFSKWSEVAPFAAAFGPPCADHLTCEWRVRSTGQGITVQHVPDQADPLPPPLVGYTTVIRGRKRVLPFSDGWLVAGDAGEHGGGLWWVNKSGDRISTLLEVPILGLLKPTSGNQVLAFGGFTHGGMGPGYVFRVTREADSWRATEIASLDQPVYILAEVGASFLVVTGKSVHMMERTGAIASTHVGKWWGRYPVSLSVLQQGAEIVIGMEGIVVVLRKTSGARYDEKWYALLSCS